MTHAPWESLSKESEVTKECTGALEKIDATHIYHVNGKVWILNEELEPKVERVQVTEYLTQEFVACAVVEDMIADANKNTIKGTNAFILQKIVHDLLIDVFKVRHNATKENVKTLLFNLVWEVFVDIIQEVKTDLF